MALIFGGGTEQGLWSDHLLQISLIPAIFMAFAKRNLSALDVALKGLILLTVGFLLFQFFPVFRVFEPELGISSGYGFFSPAPGRSAEAVIFTLVLLCFFIVVHGLNGQSQQRFLPYVFIGVVGNIVAASLQLSFEGDVAITGVLPFSIRAGMFANINHFSSLVYMAIPLLAWRFLHFSNKVTIYLGIIGTICVLQFAGGSSAAMSITLLLALLSYPLFSRSQVLPLSVLVGLGLVILVFGAVLILNRDQGLLGDDPRMEIFSITFLAIRDHWVLGSGLGTFLGLYPVYEPTELIVREYTNHAHNDYLELWLEGGLLFVILIGLYGWIYAKSLSLNLFKLAAFLAVGAVLLHSIVDYPLRTMAIGVLFAALNGIALRKNRQVISATTSR